MIHCQRFCLLLVLSLFAVAAHAQDEDLPPEPGQRIIDRTAKDAESILPQIGLGGSPTARLDSDTHTSKPIKLEVEGAEKLKAVVSTPAGMNRSHKHALVFALVGDGIDVQEDLVLATGMSSGRDPMIVCSVSYRTAREIEENVRMIEAAAPMDVRHASYDWLLAKVMKEQPINPERVFLLGARGGEDEAVEWARHLWSGDRDKFPLRGVMLDGHIMDRADGFPPVPVVLTTPVSKRFGMTKGARGFPNGLMAMGIPCQYHEYEIETNLFSHEGRWQLILRDGMHALGGPGAREYVDQGPVIGVITPADKVPFADSNDPFLQEIVSLCRAEEWARANRQLKSKLEDRSLKAKDKKPYQDFQKEFDKYVKAELERLNKSLEISIKAEAWAHSLHRARMAALLDAFGSERWCQGKPYQKNLETLKTYPPAARDAERRERMAKAVRLELSGERETAKAAYEALAKEKEQDGGYSSWPRGAEYRLSWWE